MTTKTRPISLRLTPQQQAWAEKFASEDGIAVSEYLRRAIEDRLVRDIRADDSLGQGAVLTARGAIVGMP